MAIDTFIDNVSLNKTNSLVHLLDRVEKYDIDEAGINLKHSKYFNEPTTSIYNIPGYSMFSRGKMFTNHSGLITYVND